MSDRMRISVRLGETVKLSDNGFEFLRPEVGVEDSLKAGETPRDGYLRLYKMAEALYVLTLSSMLRSRESMEAAGNIYDYVKTRINSIANDPDLRILMQTPAEE